MEPAPKTFEIGRLSNPGVRSAAEQHLPSEVNGAEASREELAVAIISEALEAQSHARDTPVGGPAQEM